MGPTPTQGTLTNPFDVDIAHVYGPYVSTNRGGLRRMMAFTLVNGRKTSMSYARWTMTQHLQRVLLPTEHVDHINEDPLDDRLDNYQLLTPIENNRKGKLGKPSPIKGIDRGWTHGTLYGWRTKKCTCDPCTAAKLLWHAERNEARRNTEGSTRGPYRPRGTREHGTRTMYKLGCRCDECRASNTEHARQYRERLQSKGI